MAGGRQGADIFDVAVIGAGVVGCAMARRFTLEGARVVVLDKAPDILEGASKANSAILHTGFDAPAGSLELDCVRAGHAEYLAIRDRLGLPLLETGAYVVAWSEAEAAALPAILERARANGVAAETVGRDRLRRAEPELSAAAVAAVHIPGEHVIDPWSAPLAYLAQALANGASLQLSGEVTGGRFDGASWTLATAAGPVRARHVVNCAGLYGDVVEEAVFGETPFRIRPRKGQFVVFDKAASRLIKAIVLPVPDERTKGIVLCRTVFGNVLVGPTAEDQDSRADASTDAATLSMLIADAAAKVPALAHMPVTAAYAGLRPASERKEYRIAVRRDANWISVGGIRSTGLTAALGIAAHVHRLYAGQGATHVPLAAPVTPKVPVLAEAGARDWQRPSHGAIVCHCELVTEREIRAALDGPLGARSAGGLKRRTRAGMGRCQGFYCSARLAELTAGRIVPPLGLEGRDG